MTSGGDDYDVGYGKPPKETRFGKGQSGNRKGRPPGSRNFATDLDEVLSSEMTVLEHGRKKKVSAQQAMMLRLREKALMGDARALDRALSLAQQLSEEKATRSAERHLSRDEDAILQRYEADLLARAAANGDVADVEGETDGT